MLVLCLFATERPDVLEIPVATSSATLAKGAERDPSLTPAGQGAHDGSDYTLCGSPHKFAQFWEQLFRPAPKFGLNISDHERIEGLCVSLHSLRLSLDPHEGQVGAVQLTGA